MSPKDATSENEPPVTDEQCFFDYSTTTCKIDVMLSCLFSVEQEDSSCC